MEYKSLNGAKLRKDLGAIRVVKSYHNKQKAGTGNFGYVIVFKTEFVKPLDEAWFTLRGTYGSNGKVADLGFGPYSSGVGRGLADLTYRDLIDYIKKYVKQHLVRL